jgi:hypothetical protein
MRRRPGMVVATRKAMTRKIITISMNVKTL